MFFLKTEFPKNYKNEEDEKVHFEAFKDNVKFTVDHNEKFKKGEASYELGITSLADKLPHEKHHLGRLPLPQ